MRPSLLPDRVYAEVRGFQWHRDSQYGVDASLQIVPMSCGDSVEPLIAASASLEDKTWW